MQGITLNDVATFTALMFGIVNLMLIFVRIGHDTKLRKAELAMRIVEAEYPRQPAWSNWPAYELFALMLPLVDEVYRTGTLDLHRFTQRVEERRRQVMVDRPRRDAEDGS